MQTGFFAAYEGFDLLVAGIVVLRHRATCPAVSVARGAPDVTMLHGNFRIGDAPTDRVTGAAWAIDGDVVYLRRLERLPDCDDEQLKHLCVLAAAVFHSHSLVVHVLDLLVARGAVGADLPEAYVAALPAELRA